MSAPIHAVEGEGPEAAAVWAMRLSEGDMSADQQLAFEAWLDADARNGELLEEIVGAWRSVDHYAGAAAVVEMREAALASARRTMRRQDQRFPTRAVIGGLIAATLLLAIGGAGLVVWLSPHTYETGVGERRVVAMNDGSTISLDAATLVKVRYSGGKRRLWLERGRAKFDVAKDSLRPFSVEAGDKTVVATGTAFSVERVRDEVRVVLYDGHVAVLQQDGRRARQIPVQIGAAPAEHLLTPGRELILPESAAVAAVRAASVEPADPVRSLSWEGGMLVFDDEPLGVVIDRMNRYAATPLALGDDRVGSLRVSGVFRAGDTEALVQGLAAGFGVQARTVRDTTALFAGASNADAG